MKVACPFHNSTNFQMPWFALPHYCDGIMGAMASQITSLTIVYSIVHSDADQRKHQSPASLAFVRGIHRWPVNSPHKGPATWKMFPFDEGIMPDKGQWHNLTKTLPKLPRVLPLVAMLKLVWLRSRTYTSWMISCLWQRFCVESDSWGVLHIGTAMCRVQIKTILSFLTYSTGPWFNIKMPSYQCGKFHYGNKTVIRWSYLCNGNSYSGKMTSLFWNQPPDSHAVALQENGIISA